MGKPYTPDGAALDLIWPDYGGEQIRRILLQRTLDESWQQRVAKSDIWLLFIRLSRITAPEDFLQRGLTPVPAPAAGETDVPPPIPDQVRLVELLQLLLHARGGGDGTRRRRPAFAVVLSAWDEIDDSQGDARPLDVLRFRMPLFSDYLAATWSEDACLVFGVSALGKTLSRDAVDDGFVDMGPEAQGRVLLPDGTPSRDLSLPLALLVERLHGE
ncbi:MAG: hypothetical protein LC667_13480 [Thioalkalivibrio sp.]|nr:hypothetical protein [Thioalkalivibrio sp.]